MLICSFVYECKGTKKWGHDKMNARFFTQNFSLSVLSIEYWNARILTKYFLRKYSFYSSSQCSTAPLRQAGSAPGKSIE